MTNKNKLWICGKKKNYDPNDLSWEFDGVYSTEQKAIEACVDDLFFIGPAILDDSFPLETVEWPGAYYPKDIKRGDPDDSQT